MFFGRAARPVHRYAGRPLALALALPSYGGGRTPAMSSTSRPKTPEICFDECVSAGPTIRDHPESMSAPAQAHSDHGAALADALRELDKRFVSAARVAKARAAAVHDLLHIHSQINYDARCPSTGRSKAKFVLVPYGSTATGLCTPGSDVDLTMVPRFATDSPEGEEEAVVELGRLVQAVRRACRTRSREEGLTLKKSFRRLKSRMRIAGFEFELDGEAVLCDVTLNNWSGLRNTRLLQQILRCMPADVAALLRCFKYWLRSHGVPDRSKSGLASYTMHLLVLRYLQAQGCFLPLDALRDYCGELRRIGSIGEANGAVEVDPLGARGALGPLDAWPVLEVLPVRPAERLEESWIGLLQFVRTLSQGGAVDLSASETKFDKASATLTVLCPITHENVNPLQAKEWQKIVRTLVSSGALRARPEGYTEEVLALARSADLPGCDPRHALENEYPEEIQVVG